MADVVVVLKILPSDSDQDIEKLKDSVESSVSNVGKVNKIGLEEIAFGLKAIRLEVIIPDEEGKIGAVEDTLQALDGVGQVDTEEVTLA